MAKHTARDRMWTIAMKVTHRNQEEIDADQLSVMAEVSERSARDVLNTMAENGVLRMEKKGRNVVYVPDWRDFD